MQDLAVIARQNEQATIQQGLDARRRQGEYVVAKYTGLHLVSGEAFADADRARAALAERRATDGEVKYGLATYQLLPPISGQVPARDQSEDRTLGDYIARKSD